MNECTQCKNTMECILEGEESSAGHYDVVEWCSGCGTILTYRTDGVKERKHKYRNSELVKQVKDNH